MTEDQPQPFAQEGEHVPPAIDGEAFHCPYCGVLARQYWAGLYTEGTAYFAHVRTAECTNCERRSFWIDTSERERLSDYRMVKPLAGGGPRAHAEMPDDVKADYEEARSIVAQSPRGACALLRLATQKLMVDLGQPGKNINDDIAALVRAGLPVEVQQAMDLLRVVGNSAVHPGEIDLKDDVATASGLFAILNFIVQDRIAQPKNIQAMFGALPQKARDAIVKRDQP